MKRILIPSVIAVLLLTGAFSGGDSVELTAQASPVSVGEFIYTVALSKEIGAEEVTRSWTHEFLEPGVNDSIFVPMLKMLRDNKVNCFAPEYPFTRQLSKEEILGTIVRYDSIEAIDEITNELYLVTVESRVEPWEIVSLTFHEEWFYDAQTLALQKIVKGIVPNASRDRGQGPVITPLVYIPIAQHVPEKYHTEVRDMTSDFHFELPAQDRASAVVYPDSAARAYQDQFNNTLLADINRYVTSAKSEVRQFPFPYATAVAKEERPAMSKIISQANCVRFRENWKVSMERQIFVKEVTALCPGTVILMDPGDEQGEVLWMEDFRYLVPVNGSAPYDYLHRGATVPRISYGVNYRSTENMLYSVMQSNTADSVRIVDMVSTITDKVQGMKYMACSNTFNNGYCDPWLPYYVMDSARVHARFFRTDSVYVEDMDKGELRMEAREYPYRREMNCGIQFYETWNFDHKKMSFEKSIYALGINRMEGVNGDDYRMHLAVPFFYFPYGRQPAGDIMKKEFLIGKNIITPVLINANEFNADVDYLGRLKYSYYDSWYNNINPSARYPLIAPVVDGILKGEIKASAAGNTSRQLTAAEFRAMLDSIYTRFMLSPNPGFEYSLFNELLFDEDWYFNPATGQLYKHVNAITFAHRAPDNWDNEVYGLPVIWPYFRVVVNTGKQ